jgi:hypothetical protein
MPASEAKLAEPASSRFGERCSQKRALFPNLNLQVAIDD